MILADKDRFDINNTDGLSQNTIDKMNMRLQEDMEQITEEHYESAVRHAKFRILQICYKFE